MALGTETENIATSVIPYETGKKADYLAKRVCGFTMKESCKLIKLSERAVRYWREEDTNFAKIDGEGLPALRKQLADEYLNIQFTRNFHLVLEKDFNVLYKDAIGLVLSKEEHEYLLKIRAHYTPQSLAMIKQLLAGGTVNQPFDFTKLTVTIKREMEQVEIRQEA